MDVGVLFIVVEEDVSGILGRFTVSRGYSWRIYVCPFFSFFLKVYTTGGAIGQLISILFESVDMYTQYSFHLLLKGTILI